MDRWFKDDGDDDNVLKDGQSLRVSMVIMDGDEQRRAAQRVLRDAYDDRPLIVDATGTSTFVGFRPGHIIDARAEATRQRAYDRYCEALTSAWCGGQAQRQIACDGESLEAAYEARDAWLRDAWRSP
jgi:hypothetical protein